MAAMKVNARMRIVRETPAEILFRYDVRPAAILFLVMGAGLFAAVRFLPSAPRLFAGGVLGLFVLIAGVGTLWREELELSFARGRWRRRAGWVGRVEDSSGDLAEIPEVALEVARASSSDDNGPSWNVEIRAARWPAAVVVASSGREEEGYAQLERWAKLLRKDAVDRTGTQSERRSLDALNAPLARRADVEAADAGGFPVRVSERPPAGSRVVVTSERGRRRIVIPPIGWSGATFAVVAFGVVFGGFGGIAGLVGAHVITGVRVNGEIPAGPVWPMAAMGGVFFLIGVAIAAAVLVGGRSREWIEDAPDRLVIGISGIGMSWGRKEILKRDIEGIDLSVSPNATWSRVAAKREGRNGPPAGAARDVRIRTDAKVFRLGRDLPEADQAWLRDALDAMARGR